MTSPFDEYLNAIHEERSVQEISHLSEQHSDRLAKMNSIDGSDMSKVDNGFSVSDKKIIERCIATTSSIYGDIMGHSDSAVPQNIVEFYYIETDANAKVRQTNGLTMSDMHNMSLKNHLSDLYRCDDHNVYSGSWTQSQVKNYTEQVNTDNHKVHIMIVSQRKVTMLTDIRSTSMIVVPLRVVPQIRHAYIYAAEIDQVNCTKSKRDVGKDGYLTKRVYIKSRLYPTPFLVVEMLYYLCNQHKEYKDTHNIAYYITKIQLKRMMFSIYGYDYDQFIQNGVTRFTTTGCFYTNGVNCEKPYTPQKIIDMCSIVERKGASHSVNTVHQYYVQENSSIYGYCLWNKVWATMNTYITRVNKECNNKYNTNDLYNFQQWCMVKHMNTNVPSYVKSGDLTQQYIFKRDTHSVHSKRKQSSFTTIGKPSDFNVERTLEDVNKSVATFQLLPSCADQSIIQKRQDVLNVESKDDTPSNTLSGSKRKAPDTSSSQSINQSNPYDDDLFQFDSAGVAYLEALESANKKKNDIPRSPPTTYDITYSDAKDMYDDEYDAHADKRRAVGTSQSPVANLQSEWKNLIECNVTLSTMFPMAIRDDLLQGLIDCKYTNNSNTKIGTCDLLNRFNNSPEINRYFNFSRINMLMKVFTEDILLGLKVEMVEFLYNTFNYDIVHTDEPVHSMYKEFVKSLQHTFTWCFPRVRLTPHYVKPVRNEISGRLVPVDSFKDMDSIGDEWLLSYTHMFSHDRFSDLNIDNYAKQVFISYVDPVTILYTIHKFLAPKIDYLSVSQLKEVCKNVATVVLYIACLTLSDDRYTVYTIPMLFTRYRTIVSVASSRGSKVVDEYMNPHNKGDVGKVALRKVTSILLARIIDDFSSKAPDSITRKEIRDIVVNSTESYTSPSFCDLVLNLAEGIYPNPHDSPIRIVNPKRMMMLDNMYHQFESCIYAADEHGDDISFTEHLKQDDNACYSFINSLYSPGVDRVEDIGNNMFCIVMAEDAVRYAYLITCFNKQFECMLIKSYQYYRHITHKAKDTEMDGYQYFRSMLKYKNNCRDTANYLSPIQKLAIEYARHITAGNTVIGGAAGCGKTTMIDTINEGQGKQPILMAGCKSAVTQISQSLKHTKVKDCRIATLSSFNLRHAQTCEMYLADFLKNKVHNDLKYNRCLSVTQDLLHCILKGIESYRKYTCTVKYLDITEDAKRREALYNYLVKMVPRLHNDDVLSDSLIKKLLKTPPHLLAETILYYKCNTKQYKNQLLAITEDKRSMYSRSDVIMKKTKKCSKMLSSLSESCITPSHVATLLNKHPDDFNVIDTSEEKRIVCPLHCHGNIITVDESYTRPFGQMMTFFYSLFRCVEDLPNITYCGDPFQTPPKDKGDFTYEVSQVFGYVPIDITHRFKDDTQRELCYAIRNRNVAGFNAIMDRCRYNPDIDQSVSWLTCATCNNRKENLTNPNHWLNKLKHYLDTSPHKKMFSETMFVFCKKESALLARSCVLKAKLISSFSDSSSKFHTCLNRLGIGTNTDRLIRHLKANIESNEHWCDHSLYLNQEVTSSSYQNLDCRVLHITDCVLIRVPYQEWMAFVDKLNTAIISHIMTYVKMKDAKYYFKHRDDRLRDVFKAAIVNLQKNVGDLTTLIESRVRDQSFCQALDTYYSMKWFHRFMLEDSSKVTVGTHQKRVMKNSFHSTPVLYNRAVTGHSDLGSQPEAIENVLKDIEHKARVSTLCDDNESINDQSPHVYHSGACLFNRTRDIRDRIVTGYYLTQKDIVKHRIDTSKEAVIIRNALWDSVFNTSYHNVEDKWYTIPSWWKSSVSEFYYRLINTWLMVNYFHPAFDALSQTETDLYFLPYYVYKTKYQPLVDELYGASDELVPYVTKQVKGATYKDHNDEPVITGISAFEDKFVKRLYAKLLPAKNNNEAAEDRDRSSNRYKQAKNLIYQITSAVRARLCKIFVRLLSSMDMKVQSDSIDDTTLNQYKNNMYGFATRTKGQQCSIDTIIRGIDHTTMYQCFNRSVSSVSTVSKKTYYNRKEENNPYGVSPRDLYIMQRPNHFVTSETQISVSKTYEPTLSSDQRVINTKCVFLVPEDEMDNDPYKTSIHAYPLYWKRDTNSSTNLGDRTTRIIDDAQGSDAKRVVVTAHCPREFSFAYTAVTRGVYGCTFIVSNFFKNTIFEQNSAPTCSIVPMAMQRSRDRFEKIYCIIQFSILEGISNIRDHPYYRIMDLAKSFVEKYPNAKAVKVEGSNFVLYHYLKFKQLSKLHIKDSKNKKIPIMDTIALFKNPKAYLKDHGYYDRVKEALTAYFRSILLWNYKDDSLDSKEQKQMRNHVIKVYKECTSRS